MSCLCPLFNDFGQLLHRKVHVGLPGAEPDFPGKDIFDLNHIVALNRERVRTTGLRRLQLHAPFSGRIGGGRRSVTPATAHGDGFPWIGGPPDRCLGFTLDHHMIRKQCRRPDIG